MVTVAAGQAAGWVAAALPRPTQLAAGNYWLGLLSGPTSGAASIYFSAVTNAGLYNVNTYPTPSTNFGSVSYADQRLSYIVDYAPTSIFGQSGALGGSATSSAPGSGYRFGTIYNLPTAGTPTDFVFYAQGGAAAQSFVPVIYATDGSGNPTNLVVQGSQTTVAAGQAAGWISSPLPLTTLASGNYLLGLLSGSTSSSASIYYDPVAGTGLYTTNTASFPTADPTFGTASSAAQRFYYYVDYLTPTTSLTVNASATDDVGVSHVEFDIDGLRFADQTSGPWSATLDTLSPTLPIYDGSHTVVVKAFDADGQVTSSSASTVTVANTANSRYRVGLTSTLVPPELAYDPSLGGSQTSWPVDLTVTNNAATTLAAASTVVRYRWYSADDTPVVTTSSDIALGGDIAAGANRTVRVNVRPPTLPNRAYRARYTLRLDLYDAGAGSYFADKGNKPLEQSVTANLATPLELGLERYQQYDGSDLGGGLSNAVNLADGNNIVSWTPFSEPGIGLDTVLTITYNSLENGSASPLGNNVSLTISGLTPLGAPLDVHPNSSDMLASRSGKWIGFVDGDGSYHSFSGQAGADGSVYWSAPAGVHLYLRQYSTSDTSRWWALTKPDRTTFFYDQNGYPTFVQDGNGNTLTLTESTVAAGDDAYGAAKHVTQVQDQGGRSFTLSYYTAATTAVAALRGKVQSISDHLGHTLSFGYYNDGNLLRISQDAGLNPDNSWQPARSLLFTYTTQAGGGPAITTQAARLNPDPTTQQSTRLYSLIDFRSNETSFAYITTSGSTQWRLASRTDRAGNTTSYSYSGATTGTLGTSTIGSGWVTNGSPYKFANKITVPTGKTYRLTDAKAYMSGSSTSGTESYKSVLWGASGSLPGSVIAVSNNAITITGGGSPTAAGWQTFSFTGSVDLTAGDYWLGFIDTGTSGAGRIAQTTGPAGSEQYKQDSGYSTIATGQAFGTPDGNTTASYSSYIDWQDLTAASSTTVAMPLSRTWTYAFDTSGRVTSITDPVNSQPTTVSWTADNTVSRVTEPSGRQVAYAYNQNGYLTDSWDEAGDHTLLVYQNLAVPGDSHDISGYWETGRTIPHISQLIAKTAPAGNLITNDGLETDTTNWNAYKTGSTISRDTSKALFGNASLAVTTPGSAVSEGASYSGLSTSSGTVSPGASYTVSAWIWAASGNALAIELDWLDSAGNYLSNGYQSIAGTGGWARYTLTATAPTGASRAKPYVLTNAVAAYSFWVDAVGLTATSSPTGTAFPYTSQFDYDTAGNSLHQSDPLANLTTFTYNSNGTLATQTLPNNGDSITRTTTYTSYDNNGLPTQVTDAAGGITRASYDAAGNLLSLQDPDHGSYSGGTPAQYQSQYVYDRFGRLIRSSNPKSTQFTPGVLIWTDTSYDASDNVVSQMNAHYGGGDSQGAAVTTTTYDALDRPTLVTSPDSVGGSKQTRTDYDAAGRVTEVTQPLGVSSSTIAHDYATITSYDLLDRVASTIQYTYDTNGTIISAQTRTSNYCYDLAGDLRSVTGPLGASGFSCPAVSTPGSYSYTAASDTSKYAYDFAHRQISVTDPLGNTSSLTYNPNGATTSTTDANGNTTTTSYDNRGSKTKVVQPFDPGSGRTITSLFEYDALGNLKREISPRAYDTSTDKVTFTYYVTSHSYDALNRETTTTLPIDASTTQAYLQRAYDANGNLLWTSLPTTQSNPANVAAADKTTNQYWDGGAIYSTSAPAAPTLRYDYSAEGWQTSRIPETAIGSGLLDYGRMQLWAYLADGKRLSQTDQAGLRDTHAYDLDGNQTSVTEALGAGNPSTALPVSVTASYDGFNQPTKVRIPENLSSNYWATVFAYDQHGNTTTLTENQKENAGGTVITPGRTQTYTYNALNQLTAQVDDYATPGSGSAANDDEQISFTYTPIGLEASKTIAKANGSGGWTNEQQVSKTYYANGLLNTLTTTDGGSPANTLAQHTLSYLSSSIYLNGNRASDVFQLKGPDNTAACYSTTCTASWSYDARDRLTQEINGSGTTTAYTLNIYGDITQETQNGSTTRTATYSGLQLTTDTVSGTTKKYLYDSLGNLNCVVTNAWAGSTCPSITGSIDPSLITYNSFDTKNRLTATYTYSSGTLTDSATYTLDALDRTLSETETHSGTTTRTDTSYIGLSNATSQEQLFNSSGTITETKSYVYDANGRRDTLTENIASGATTRYSYAYDPHGSVELLIDQNRTTKAAYGYTAYGASNLSLTKTAPGFSTNTNLYRYGGQRLDTGSGTVDFGTRRYSPTTQRFIQRDSYFAALDDLGLSTDPLTGNRYALTGANPIGFVDIDGHRPEVEGDDYAVWSYNGFTLVSTSSGTTLAPVQSSDGGERTPQTSGGGNPGSQMTGCDVAAGDLSCNLADLANAPWQARENWVANMEYNNGFSTSGTAWFDVFIGIIDYFKQSKVFSNSQRMKTADAVVLLEVEKGLVAAKAGQGGSGWTSFFELYYQRGDVPHRTEQLKSLWGSAEQAGVDTSQRIVNGYDGRAIRPGSKAEASLESQFIALGNRYRSAVTNNASPFIGFPTADPRYDRVRVEAAALTLEAAARSPLHGFIPLIPF